MSHVRRTLPAALCLVALAAACERQPTAAGPLSANLAPDEDRMFSGLAFVRDPDGNPLSGVHVRLTAYSRYNRHGEVWDHYFCDAEGDTDGAGQAYLRCSIPPQYAEEPDGVYLAIADGAYSVLGVTEADRRAFNVQQSFTAIRDRDHNLISDAVELPLARKFAPQLVLHSADRGVRPSPVEIMDRNGDGRLGPEDVLVQVYNLGLMKLGEFRLDEILFNGGDHLYEGKYQYPYLSAIMKAVVIPGYHMAGDTVVPDNPETIYILVPHFEWGEIGSTSPGPWYGTWDEAIGRHAGDPRYTEGTTYASLFRRDGSAAGEVVIQYWFFYPFNPAANRHEGDWEHVNVVLDSPNLATGRILRVEYYYHEEVVVAREPGVDYTVADSTHPVVYVGGSNSACGLSGDGTHGSYPHSGAWPNILDETVDGLGLRIDFDGYRNVELVPDQPARTVFLHDPDLTYAIGWQHFAGLWGYPLSKPLPCETELDLVTGLLVVFVTELPIGGPFAVAASAAVVGLRAAAGEKLEDSNIAAVGPRYHKRWHTTTGGGLSSSPEEPPPAPGPGEIPPAPVAAPGPPFAPAAPWAPLSFRRGPPP